MADFSPEIEKFYKEILNLLIKNKIPFLIGGGLAVKEYGPNIGRPMKDVDVFCKAGDSLKIMSLLKEQKYKTVIQDARWLAEVRKDGKKLDFIFSAPNRIYAVDDSWFETSRDFKLLGLKVKLISPEDLILCKAYIQDRTRYDGGDINHIMAYQGKKLDWKRLLFRMEADWELLFSIIMNFRYVYPSEHDVVPGWLIDELVVRLQYQMKHPVSKDKVCRGPLISRSDYIIDVTSGGYPTN